jgi:hypothetical protein
MLITAAHQLGVAFVERGGVFPTIESDCKGLLTRAHAESRRRADRSVDTRPLACFYRVIRRVELAFPNLRRHWVRSHAEARCRPQGWSGAECRNVNADRLAKPRPVLAACRELSRIPHPAHQVALPEGCIPMHVSANTVLTGLFERGYFFWTTLTGEVLVHSMFADSRFLVQQYLANRD